METPNTLELDDLQAGVFFTYYSITNNVKVTMQVYKQTRARLYYCTNNTSNLLSNPARSISTIKAQRMIELGAFIPHTDGTTL